jgi:hypothetical protein
MGSSNFDFSRGMKKIGEAMSAVISAQVTQEAQEEMQRKLKNSE